MICLSKVINKPKAREQRFFPNVHILKIKKIYVVCKIVCFVCRSLRIENIILNRLTKNIDYSSKEWTRRYSYELLVAF